MTLDELKNASKEQILDRLGLAPKPDFLDYLFPVLGIFGAGMLLGAGLGLMLAPKPGAELRGDLAERMRSLRSGRGNEQDAPAGAQPLTRA